MSDYGPALIGPYGMAFVMLYLGALVVIGVIGRFSRRENSLKDHYLCGGRLGLLVLFLTLFATQYSGNTLIGYGGRAYRQGFGFLISIIAMMSVVGAYLFFAPRLHSLAKKHGFVTIGDFVQHRFSFAPLTIAVTLVCIIALGNYILSNLKAIGYIVEASTGGIVGFEEGIIILAFVMVLYETLGGLRSVAWTDVMQGVLLFLGCVLIFVIVQVQYGGISGVADKLLWHRREFFEPPSFTEKCSMFSTILLFFFGVSVYPHAIQRIYAARDSLTLRRSLQLMVFTPLVTSFFIIVVGLVGAAEYPHLSKDGSERITLIMLSDMARTVPAVQALLVVFITAAGAAIMSTVDSALLAVSSLFTQDIYRRMLPHASQSHLTSVGKLSSWLIIGFMSVLAIYLPETIWRLIEIKLELLCQVAPAIFLGIGSRKISGQAIFCGLLAGVTVSLAFQLAVGLGLPVPAKPFGIHAGIWGLCLNFLVVFSIAPLPGWVNNEQKRR